MAEIVEQVPRLCVSFSFASNGEPDTNLPPTTAHIRPLKAVHIAGYAPPDASCALPDTNSYTMSIGVYGYVESRSIECLE